MLLNDSVSLQKKGIFFFGILLLFSGWGKLAMVSDLVSAESGSKVIGGPCEYREYKGRATIISIRKKDLPPSGSGPSYSSFDVMFTFHPSEKIEEPFAQTEGREYPLMLANSWHPGPKFLEKYGIGLGKSLDCYLKVITKGTCAPTLFVFPTIELNDYFEGKKF